MVGLIRWIGVENDADEDDDNDADDEDMASPTGVSSVSLKQFGYCTWEIHTVLI